MKKLRATFALLLLASVAFGQRPLPATCELALAGMAVSAHAAMPCCHRADGRHAHMPISCPALKSQAPHDTIDNPAGWSAVVLQVVYAVGDVGLLPVLSPRALSYRLTEAVPWLIPLRPILGRAPPTDCPLLSA